MEQSLKGKVALVTGAGRGIGKAVALALANEGVTVGLLARTETDLKEVVGEIEERGGKGAYVAVDISSRDEVEQAVKKLTDELGATDILINNAG